jgi:hypothetical protein
MGERFSIRRLLFTAHDSRFYQECAKNFSGPTAGATNEADFTEQ